MHRIVLAPCRNGAGQGMHCCRVALGAAEPNRRLGVRIGKGRGMIEAMSRSEPITAAEYTYTVLLQPEPEGGFTVTCPSLPGLVTYGETVEEARAMAAEAIECYLESMQKDGLPLPESDTAAAPRAEPVSVKLAMA